MTKPSPTAHTLLSFDVVPDVPATPNCLERFCCALVSHIAAREVVPSAQPLIASREVVPSAQPLIASPWQAMSLLQKAVRRGETAFALRAAATLLQDAPERLWRRLGGIVFEDIGVADLQTVGLVTAGLGGKRVRQQLGGEWVVASFLVARMCAAPKSRSSDDLLMSVQAMPQMAQLRMSLAQETDARLASIVQGAACLHTRALALLYLWGTNRRPTPAFRPRTGNPGLTFQTLVQTGVSPTVVSLGQEGVRRTGEVLPLLVSLLTQENGVRDEASDDLLPPHAMIADLPGWTLDTYTREGRRALGLLLKTDAPIAHFVRDTMPPTGRVEFAGQVLFRAEGGLMRQRLGGATSEWLRTLMESETLGLNPATAREAIVLLRASLPLLDSLRADVMEGR